MLILDLVVGGIRRVEYLGEYDVYWGLLVGVFLGFNSYWWYDFGYLVFDF